MSNNNYIDYLQSLSELEKIAEGLKKLRVIIKEPSEFIKDPKKIKKAFLQEDATPTGVMYPGAGTPWFDLDEGKQEGYKHAEEQEKLILESGIIDTLRPFAPDYHFVVLGGASMRSEKHLYKTLENVKGHGKTTLIDIAPDILKTSLTNLDYYLVENPDISIDTVIVYPRLFEEIPLFIDEIREEHPKLIIVNYGSINEKIRRIGWDSKAQVLISQFAEPEDIILRTEHVIDSREDYIKKQLEEIYSGERCLNFVSKNPGKFAGVKREDIQTEFDNELKSIAYFTEGGIIWKKKKIFYISEKPTKEELDDSYRTAELKITDYKKREDSMLAHTISKSIEPPRDSALLAEIKKDILIHEEKRMKNGYYKDESPEIIYFDLDKKELINILYDLIKNKYRPELQNEEKPTEGLTCNERKIKIAYGTISILKTGEEEFIITPHQRALGNDPYGAIIEDFLRESEMPENYRYYQDLGKLLKNIEKEGIIKDPINVLIIEDEERTLRGLEEHFKQNYKNTPLKVDGFTSPKDALEAFDRAIENGAGYAAVVTDIKMPEMSGLEVFEYIKEKTDETNKPLVIGMSAYTTVGTLMKFVGEAYTRYLAKPFNVKKIDSALCDGIQNYVDYKKVSLEMSSFGNTKLRNN